MKSTLKRVLVAIMGSQVRRLRQRNNFKIIGVVGSIGKTSTKLAIAKVLASDKRMRYQEGNYNDIVSVPLVFFGQSMPSLWNIWQWFVIIIKNEVQIYLEFPFDVVVVELGTDAPGQIEQFRKYLHLDIAVLTAVAPEHMEFFESIEKVAEEEWSVGFFSDLILANKDLCEVSSPNLDNKKIIFYGQEFGSLYKIENISKVKDIFNFDISYESKKIMNLSYEAFSEVQLYSICAAAIIAKKFNISDEKIKKAISETQSFSGRMQKLKGIKNSTIIDDTYNASPEAVKMALDALYAQTTDQRIAILGMMNELGDISAEEHKKIGQYCNPKFLDLVVTVGSDANAFLAKAARANGCEVYEAKNSTEAGQFVKDKILPAQAEKNGAVILAKGSQNGVFTEEALKPLLKNKADFAKLVRQDKYWMNRKSLTLN
jgi:UDP-N-acetylmuramoyl-tripeptide--D-alanyl-D-alanine ligase